MKKINTLVILFCVFCVALCSYPKTFTITKTPLSENKPLPLGKIRIERE